MLLNYINYQKDNEYDNGFEKRKSNFRERVSGNNYLISEKETGDNYGENGIEYLRLLRNLWSKYRQAHPENIDIEDLTDEQVEDILNSLSEDGNNEELFGEYPQVRYGNIPLRNRRNYRVFEHLKERKKRYPAFGEGIYGKRNSHSQHVSYEAPPENDFLYALKFVNPNLNREAVENLKEGGFEVLGDERDKDVMRILNKAAARPKYVAEEEPYWASEQKPYDGVWWQESVGYPEEAFQDYDSKNDKRNSNQRIFKQHNGLHLNRKRFPVKRSPLPLHKDATDEKVSKELKGIFGTPETSTSPPKKKGSDKKPVEPKKQNTAKAENPKNREVKKLVRRAEPYTKEEIYPPIRNEEISNLFNVKKKSVDQKPLDRSRYFENKKRSPQIWFRNDNAKRAESHFLSPKNKRYSDERANVGNVNFLDKSQYEIPFDTRVFHNDKRFSYDIGSNIDKIENKIGNIEDKIIDDALKYTGAHSGGNNEDVGKVKSEVIHHLDAALSLEKMRSALEEFKNSMKSDKKFAESQEAKKTGTESPNVEVLTTTGRLIISLSYFILFIGDTMICFLKLLISPGGHPVKARSGPHLNRGKK